MNKKFIIINGPMGVGKTTICKELYSKLNNSVWLDGDWCWMMNPWNITEENKLMVMNNIRFILKSYLSNSNFDYIIFSWVMHEENIFKLILNYLEDFDLNFDLYKISLICSKDTLIHRMINDNRENKFITSSINRLNLYNNMDTIKIDTTNKNVSDIVKNILRIIS